MERREEDIVRDIVTQKFMRGDPLDQYRFSTHSPILDYVTRSKPELFPTYISELLLQVNHHQED